MSWQEELRKLDEELASGRLSADDYRVRRDQVLSSAVAHGEAAGPAGQQQYPQQGPPQGPPQQPYQQQGTPQQYQPQGQPPSVDSTQVIAPLSPPQGMPQQPVQDPGSERTQAVPSWQTQQPIDPNRTQYVPPPQPPISPPGGFPQTGQQPWNTADADLAPPWGGSDFPPIAPPGSSEWVKQGPEVFEDRPRRGKGGRIALIAIVAVLVIGGGITAVVLATSGQDQASPTTTAQPTGAPASTQPASPNQQLLDKIPPLAGTADKSSGLISTAELTQLGIMDSGEVSLLSTRSVDEVAWRGSTKEPDQSGPGNEKISVTVIPLDSPSTATALVGQLRQYYAKNQLTQVTPNPFPDMSAKVVFHKTTQPPFVYRGTWVSGNNVVRVNVTQGSEGEERSVSGVYQRAVKTLLSNYPASN